MLAYGGFPSLLEMNMGAGLRTGHLAAAPSGYVRERL